MLSACAMVMATALTGVGQVELVEFTADWCGACQQMQPVITRLEADGFSVRQLDFEQNRAMAERAGVRALPTMLLLVDGREVKRFTGQQSYEQLRGLLAQASENRSSPPEHRSPPPLAATPTFSTPPLSTAVRGQTPAPRPRKSSPIEQAMRATVRIRIDDSRGRAIGTGTIVDMHQNEALVLTCGHIFRDSNGKGAIQCDLFVDGQPRTVPGRMISWDLRRDVGLISIKPGIAVRPIKVAGPGQKQRPGDRVFSIGCNQGSDPTVMENRVIAVNRYHGPANLVVGGRPIDGRSGGGLFTTEGLLIGICNAADQEEDEGLYAAIAPIHAELDSAKLGFVYRQRHTPLASVSQPPATPFANHLGPPPPSSTATILSPARGQTPLASPAAASGSRQADPRNIPISQLIHEARDSEVICIIRNRENPTAKSKVYVLEQPSTQFLGQLSTEISRRGALATTGLRNHQPPRPPSTANSNAAWQHARPTFRR